MNDACEHFCESFINDLVNKIKIHTNLIKLFHFEIYIILFISESSIYFII